MHIPDGYLSPQTSVVFTVAAVPMWAAAARKVQRVVKSRYVPLVAISAAFSFLIMMFNVPVPDGTTAHAVGGGLIAILLGPWAAVIAVSVALLIQALFFGDGGVLAFPVNVINMAVVLPFVAYGIYRLMTRNASLTSTRRVLAAAVGGYVGLNAAALAAAVEFGVQPDLFKAADGTPLYAPFHLSQTIPAMMLAHLVIAGVVEGAITAGVIAYLQRANLPLLRINAPGVPLTDAEMHRRPVNPVKAAAIAIGVLVLLTPLGLLAPGGAFGEDAPEDLDLGKYGLNALPTGLEKYNAFWSHTVLADYGFGSGDHPMIAYLVSAVVGIVIVGLLVYAIALLLRRFGRGAAPPDGTDPDAASKSSTRVSA